MPAATPILIMSSERSGSNLVRSLLAAHPSVAGPPPVQMLTHLGLILPHYGPLTDDANLHALIDDAVSLTCVQNCHLRWDRPIDRDAVLRQLQGLAPAYRRSLAGVCLSMYRAYAAAAGADATHVAIKENQLFDHAEALLAAEPDTRVVYLCRDGRDVACSMRKVPTHDHHPHCIANEWKAEQLACMRVYQNHARRPEAAGRALLLRYEDLLAEPDAQAARLCAFLNLSAAAADLDAMLRFNERDTARADATKTAYWRNLDKSIGAMSSNSGKFMRELSPRQVAQFEAVASDTLQLLGYDCVSEQRCRKHGPWATWWYGLLNRWATRRDDAALLDEPGRRERRARLDAIRKRRWAPRQPRLLPEADAPVTPRSEPGRAERSRAA